MSITATLAIIGGSGLYSMPGLTDTRELDLDTPFGKPSAPIVVGTLENQKVAFLARHGLGHSISPSDVNYRANIYALKSLGVERVVGINACGSLREDYAPGHIVIPDQIYDNTRLRTRSFFGDGLVAHISVAEPFCRDLSDRVGAAVKSTGAVTHLGGAFITIEGPRFSTKAESNTFRAWGMSIVGMTASPEAFLAREAEMCYAIMAHVTDYDVWHVSETPVSVEMIIETLKKNTLKAQDAVRKLAASIKPALPHGGASRSAVEGSRGCECESALSSALITDPARIPASTKSKLKLLIEKYIQ